MRDDERRAVASMRDDERKAIASMSDDRATMNAKRL